MKKFLVLLLIAVLLTGCAPTQEIIPTKATVPSVTEEIAVTEPEEIIPTEVETEPVALIEQLPMVSVSVPHTVDTITGENDDVIYRQTTQFIQLIMQDPDVAKKITLDFMNRVSDLCLDEAVVREAAKAAYGADDYWDTYFFDVIYNPARVDHSVLSLTGEAASYSGSNRPQRTCIAANYNMVTGDVLTLGSILYHIDAKNKLADLVIAQLDAVAEEKHLMDGYQDVARKRFNRDESFDEDWYFSSNGLCFYFAPYEIAPYTSGIIIAEIPYSELTGIIADDFFPPEEDVLEGNILTAPMSSADLDQFTQVTDLTIDQNADVIFLYPEGAVRNVRIQSGVINADGKFEDAYTLFGTYTLTPGDAIQLTAQISNETPLRVCYESGSEYKEIILSSEN